MPEEINAAFASQAWFNHVYTSPPVRAVKGRCKWTHRHLTWVQHLNRLAYIESRNELIGLLALEYLQRRGEIRRFKEQPFKTPLEFWEAGNQGEKIYTPDFLAEDASGTNYVIEVKSARYITRAMEEGFETLKGKFADHGLKFLVWTDRSPLTTHLRQNLLRLRRASVEYIEPDEISRLQEALRTKGSMPLWALHADDFDIDLVARAAWFGKVFFPLREPFDGRTLVTLGQTQDLAETLFDKEPDINTWWNSLEAA